MTPDRAQRPGLLVAGGAALATLGLLGVGITIAALLVGGSGSPAALAAPSAARSMAGMAMAPSEGAAYWKKVAGRPFESDGVTRTYYIGADKVGWDYAPDGRNEITGKPFDAVADTYVKRGPGRIGSRYVKCLYRGYTDATFTHLKPRPAEDAYLGFLGPVIRAQVGDTIKVVFRNSCPFPTSVHPHGVFYAKDSEGAPYNDGTSGPDKLDDAVPPGGRHTYVWKVPERAGPGPGEGSSVMWMYHSHADEVSDTYGGLMGPMEITRRGMARPDGSPKDVDREVFALFSVMNENASPFLPMIKLKKGERVRWYVMSMGTEVDLHTPHWHGNTVLVNGMRMDTSACCRRAWSWPTWSPTTSGSGSSTATSTTTSAPGC
jgi:manganese oxidase